MTALFFRGWLTVRLRKPESLKRGPSFGGSLCMYVDSVTVEYVWFWWGVGDVSVGAKYMNAAQLTGRYAGISPVDRDLVELLPKDFVT